MTAPPPAALVASIRTGWQGLDAPRRLAVLVGAVLAVIGLAHLAAYAAVGGDWFGPLGWRKPFAFGVSFGITTATLGIATGPLLHSRRARWCACGLLAAANTLEVAWVSIQRARGVPSHFNFDTALDTAFFLANGIAIAVTVSVIVVLAVQAFRVRSLDPAVALAWQVGLVTLLVSMTVGGWMIARGIAALDIGAVNLTTIAPAGQLKIPHALGMHGIQVLPLLAWSLGFTSTGKAERHRLVAWAGGGYVLLAGVGLAQAAAGRALTDPGLVLAALTVAGLLAIAWAYAVAARGLWSPPDPPTV